MVVAGPRRGGRALGVWGRPQGRYGPSAHTAPWVFAPPGAGAPFLWRNGGKSTRGKEVLSPWTPNLWFERNFGTVVLTGFTGLRPLSSRLYGPAHQLGGLGQFWEDC